LTGIADEKYSKLAGRDIDQFIQAYLLQADEPANA
jgi:hypothetical protein